MRYQKVSLREDAVLFDSYKWLGPTEFAISVDCQRIAVQPHNNLASLSQSDERNEKIYLYDCSGRELTSFRHSYGGEKGVAFWPDDRHLLLPGYNLTKYQMTITQYDLVDNSIEYPFDDTILGDNMQHIIGYSRSRRFLAGRFASASSSKGYWYYDRLTRNIRTTLDYAQKAIFSDMDDFAWFTAGITRSINSPGETSAYLVALASGESIPRSNYVGIDYHKHKIFGCFLSHSKQCLFSHHNQVVICSSPKLEVVRSVEVDSEIATSACVSYGEEIIFLGCDNGDIVAISSDDLSIIGRFISGSTPGWDAAINNITISPDNRTLIATNRHKAFVYSLQYS